MIACSFLSPWHNLSFSVAVAIFFCSFMVSFGIVRLVKKYAPALGLMDMPGERKVHTKIIPRGGGIAIFIGVLVSYVSGYFLISFCTARFPEWIKFAQIPAHAWQEILLIVSGGVVIFITGLLDDIYDLKPRTKLALESFVALGLIFYNIRATVFIESYSFSLLVSLFWMLLITNSFNLLDNMDGLSSGVALISGIIFLVVAVQTGQWMIAFLLVGLLGGILGFFCYNFPPASIFMGDCGSLFIGYMMSVLTIHATFYQKASVYPVVLPILLLAVPLFDTSTVIFLRIKVGSSIFKGDKRHFSHRLVNLGMNSYQAVLTIYLVTLSTGLGALLLYQVDIFGAVIILVQTLGTLSIIYILERSGNEAEKHIMRKVDSGSGEALYQKQTSDRDEKNEKVCDIPEA